MNWKSFALVIVLFSRMTELSAQAIPVQLRLVNTYVLPNTYEEGGVYVEQVSGPTGGGQSMDEYPIWRYIGGKHYFMSRDLETINIFSDTFSLLETIESGQTAHFTDAQYSSGSFAVLDNLDYAVSQRGLVARYDMRGNVVASYNMQKELLKKLNLSDVSFLTPEASYPIYANRADLVYVTDSLMKVFRLDGSTLATDAELKEYCKNDVFDRLWARKNPKLANEMVQALVPVNGFLGHGRVYGADEGTLRGILLGYFRDTQKIAIDPDDFYAHGLWATERGFWVRARDLRGIFIFDLAANKVFSLRSLVPTYIDAGQGLWNDVLKKAYTIGMNRDPNTGSRSTVIREYSMDFL